MKKDSRVKAIISLDAVEHNFREMRKNIAECLELPVNRVNVKATTEEKLGFTGAGLGISSQAVCLLETVGNYDYDVMGMNQGGCAGCQGCPVRQ